MKINSKKELLNISAGLCIEIIPVCSGVVFVLLKMRKYEHNPPQRWTVILSFVVIILKIIKPLLLIVDVVA